MSAQTKTRDTDAWMPTKAGDSITGIVEEVAIGTSEYGQYPLLTIKEDNGQVTKVHGFRTVLQNLIVEKQPMIGEHLTVYYDGPRAKRESDGANNPPVLYRLVIDSRDSMREARRMYAKLEGKPISDEDSLATDHAETAPF